MPPEKTTKIWKELVSSAEPQFYTGFSTCAAENLHFTQVFQRFQWETQILHVFFNVVSAKSQFYKCFSTFLTWNLQFPHVFFQDFDVSFRKPKIILKAIILTFRPTSDSVYNGSNLTGSWKVRWNLEFLRIFRNHIFSGINTFLIWLLGPVFETQLQYFNFPGHKPDIILKSIIQTFRSASKGAYNA